MIKDFDFSTREVNKEEGVILIPEKEVPTLIPNEEVRMPESQEKPEDDIYSIKNFENKVTLFYSLATGEIKLTAGGVQDMGYFGTDRADFNYGYLVIDKDDYLLSNLNSFVVSNGKVKLKYNPLSKYDVA